MIDYCWRLAELDLGAVTRFLRAQQAPLKNEQFLELFRKSRRDVEVSKQLSGQEQLWANKAREN